MRTRHIDEWVTAIVEDDLPANRREEILAHLHACAQCAARVEELRALTADLRALPAPPVPHDLAAAVRARLADARPAPRPLLWRWPVWVSGGATALAGLALALMLNTSRAPQVPVAKDKPPAPTAGTPRTSDNAGYTRGPVVDTGGALLKPKPDGTRVAGIPMNQPASPPPPRVVTAVAVPADAVRTASTAMGSVVCGDVMATHDGLVAAEIAPVARPVRVVDLPPMPEAGPSFPGKDGVQTSDPDSVRGHKMASGDGGMVSYATRYPMAPVAPAPTVTATASSNAPDAAPGGAALGWSVDDVERTRPLKFRNQNTARMDADSYCLADATSVNGCVQQLSVGTVEAQANVLPADGKPNVLLRMGNRAPGTLTLRYADAPDGPSQSVPLLGAAGEDVVVRLPEGARGATLKLTVTSGRQTDELYLIVPGDQARKATSTIALNGEAPVKALAQLANEGGVVVLCPADFAERPVYANLTNTAPVAALSTLAAKRDFQADVCDTVVNIAPTSSAGQW